MNLAPKAQLYVVVVAAAGLMVVGHCIESLLNTPIAWEWGVLAGLTLLSGSFTVRVPSIQARISVSETFVFTSVLLFGTCAGTLTVALDTLVAALSSRRRAREPLRILFNLSSAALSIWSAGNVFYLLAGIEPLSTASARVPELLGPLVAMTSVYFLLNSGLVAVALSMERDEPAYYIWRKNFLWLSVNYFGGASVAALLVSYTRTIDFAALSIIVPLLVISYLTYKTSLGRVEDADQHVEEVNRLYLSTIETLATAIDAKDQVTHGHIRRVQRFAVGLAKHLGVEDPLQLKAMEAAALLHDMGKIAVPEHILNKPSRLTAGEFEKMKLHASIGADILSSIRFPYPVVPIVRHHHENWDGTGYPDGLRGTSIPLGARILAVVDCFDALTSDRPYRSRLSDDAALQILMERRGVMYDPLVVDRFVATKDDLMDALSDGVAIPNNVEDLIKSPLMKTPSHAAPTARSPERQKLTGHLELRQAIRTVLTAVNKKTDAIVSIVYLRDSSNDELVATDAYGSNGELLTGTTLPLGTRVSGWVAANGRAIVNSEARLEFPDLPSIAESAVCSALPIGGGGEIWGVLLVVRAEDNPFTSADIAYLELVCLRFTESPLRELVASATSKLIVPGSRPERPIVH